MPTDDTPDTPVTRADLDTLLAIIQGRLNAVTEVLRDLRRDLRSMKLKEAQRQREQSDSTG